jgi:hypothetical protein
MPFASSWHESHWGLSTLFIYRYIHDKKAINYRQLNGLLPVDYQSGL